ncbi:hypothetical protein AYI68_g6852, partial [Smittium mucronatum]
MADPRMQLLKRGWYWEVQPAKFVLERYRPNTRKLWCPSPKCIGRGSSSFNRDSNGKGRLFFVDILNGDIRNLPEPTNWESLLPEPAPSYPVPTPATSPPPAPTPAPDRRTESKFPPRLRISASLPSDDDSDFISISRMKTIWPMHISGHPSLAAAAASSSKRSSAASISSSKRRPSSAAAAVTAAVPFSSSSKPSSSSHSNKRKR